MDSLRKSVCRGLLEQTLQPIFLRTISAKDHLTLTGTHNHTAIDVDNDVRVVEPARVSAGAKIGDVPGPYFIRLLRAVSGRPAAETGFPGGSAARVQSPRSEKTVKRRERTPVLLVFIQKLVESLRQAEIAHILPTESLHDLLPQILRDLPGTRKIAPVEPSIAIRGMPPVLQCTRSNSNCFAGQPLRQSQRLTEIDQ